MARFILIPGSWHGGWCWEKLIPILRAQGHEVLAPDLPGMGDDAGSGPASTHGKWVPSLDDWAIFVAGLASASIDPAILVGHSRGGIVISRAAEIAPSAVRRLVYVSGVMPLSGQTLFEAVASHREQAAEEERTFGVSDDGQWLIWRTKSARGASTFYNLCDPQDADAALRRLTPEPRAVMETPIHLTAGRFGTVARSYIRCERDLALPPETQAKMITAQPCDTWSLDCDHSPFFSDPEGLGDILNWIAR